MNWHGFYKSKTQRFRFGDYLRNLSSHSELFDSIVKEKPKKKYSKLGSVRVV